MKRFPNIIGAAFTSRPNRFVVECVVRGRPVRAYLPNPGRLRELLLPGARLFLAAFPPSPERRLPYLVVAVERNGMPVMLHTHHSNTVARHLLERDRIPGLEGARVVKPEHTIGRSRFDFLLKRGGRDVLLEVKSCTLFSGALAMFPDAVTARGTRHLQELASLSRKGLDAAVLFIVHAPDVRFFMPEHHTDLEFSRTLLSVRNRVMVKAIAVGWNRDLTIRNEVRELAIPWDMVRRESRDSGSYILVLRLPRNRRIPVGGLGGVRFRKGFYLYVGSAKKDLTRRIDRHRSKRKNLFWHIDYLREHSLFHAVLPIRTGADLECKIAASLSTLADWRIARFGSSDCFCETHLFGMKDDPVRSPAFIEMLLYFRMGRLEEELMGRHRMGKKQAAGTQRPAPTGMRRSRDELP